MKLSLGSWLILSVLASDVTLKFSVDFDCMLTFSVEFDCMQNWSLMVVVVLSIIEVFAVGSCKGPK